MNVNRYIHTYISYMTAVYVSSRVRKSVYMQCQIQYRSLCAMHRHYLGDAIPFVPPITFGVHHSHNTRCPSSFANLPRCRLSFTQHFFHYRTAKWWNQIPLDIVSQSRSHFPSALYSYLLNK